ncbi:MAG: aminoglycoside phosphotransferase family protein [Alphaproteobacteria bacterium]|nr:aminoglycoside phosphotransferase family protein [Alphaproteobacteria bacterium]
MNAVVSGEQGFDLNALRTRARIGAHVVWDHLTQPKAVTGGDVPWCAEAITPEWLTAMLCRESPGAAVTGVAVAGGSSGSSVRRRIEVTYNEAGRGAGLPAVFFAKTTPTLLTRLSSAMAAAKEGAFFRDIRPELPIEAPHLYVSVHDRRSGRSLHLFGDLVASRRASFCNWKTPISRAQAEEIVDTLATFHGRFLDSPRFEDTLRWLPRYESFVSTGERDGVRAGHDQAMVAAADLIPADVTARKDDIYPLMMRGLTVHAELPRTLLHSDVHLGNWYITGDGHMGLCDWALVCRGHWSRDFAYAVSTTLEVADRRAWEQDLLRRYLDRMEEIAGVRIPFDEAWRHYRRQTFAALLMWTPTLCHPPTMPDMQPEAMSLEMIRRITAAISDLDSFNSWH